MVACESFSLDLTAGFGVCKCGHPKALHRRESFPKTSHRATNLGAPKQPRAVPIVRPCKPSAEDEWVMVEAEGPSPDIILAAPPWRVLDSAVDAVSSLWSVIVLIASTHPLLRQEGAPPPQTLSSYPVR